MNAAPVLILQHIEIETPGIIADALTEAKLTPQIIHSYAGEPIPASMDGADGLIVLGGPMGVYDHPQFPFLKQEMRLIEDALRAEKPVLGICLGSQLLAAALGAPVYKGKQKEIGWYSVTLTKEAASDPLLAGMPTSFTACHWHGDVFDLPRGAVSLASSALTQHQAFRYGKNAYGFLFHMEITEPMLRTWVAAFADELRAAGLDGTQILTHATHHLPPLHYIARPIFKIFLNKQQPHIPFC